MSSWAREVLVRLFSTRNRSRATSDTTASKPRAATSHRRRDSQPPNHSPPTARPCLTRSQTRANAVSRLPDHVTLPDEHDEKYGHRYQAAATVEVQQATRRALEQTTDASFLAHDPTIEWQPPTWEDLWKEPSRRRRTHSHSRLSTFTRTSQATNGNSERQLTSGTRNRSVSRKSSFEDLRSSARPDGDRSTLSSGATSTAWNSNSKSSARPRHVKRSSMRKQLPKLPSETTPRLTSELNENAARNARIVRSLHDDGILDLDHSEDTHTAVVWRPAVTHEQRVVQPVEIVQRAVSRDVHNHHIIHRLLPIVDLQVLPARHFIPDDCGGYVEISEDKIPGGKPGRLDELIAEAITKSSSQHEGGMSASKGASRAQEDQSRHEEHVGANNSCRHVSTYGQCTGRDLWHPSAAAAAPFSQEEERARPQSFQYRTPDGLPSWTAITTELQLQPPTAANAPPVAVAAAAPGDVAALLLKHAQPTRAPIHTILPVHVAYGCANAASS